MTQTYDKGLCFELNKDRYEQFKSEHPKESDIAYSNWKDGKIPTYVYVKRFEKAGSMFVYTTVTKYKDGTVDVNTWKDSVFESVVDQSVLESTETYDLEFVESVI